MGIRFLIVNKHLDKIRRNFTFVLPCIKDRHQILVVRLVETVVLVEFMQWLGLVRPVPVLGAAHILMEREAKELPLFGFLEGEGVESAQDGPRFVDGAIARFLVQKMAPLMVPAQCHEITLVAHLKPGGVVVLHARNLIGLEKLEEFIGVGPLHADDTDNVPRRRQANDLGAAVATVMAGESYAV